MSVDMQKLSKSIDDLTKDLTVNIQKNTEIIKDALFVRAKGFNFGWLQPNQVIKADPKQPDWIPKEHLVKDEDYVEIKLKSMRIPYQAIMVQTYFGTVHSFISLTSLSGGRADFAVVTTPSNLQNVNAEGLSRVTQSDISLLGNVPYRGGDIKIEIGLFSVVASDLLVPFLKIIENISNTAGVSIVSQAIPFVQPIESAIYHLLGYSNSNKLEVGIKTSLCKEGYLVIIGAPEKRTRDLFSKLNLQPNGQLLLGGSELDCAYMVLQVKARPDRNWIEIPNLLKAYENLTTILKTTDDKTTIEKSFDAFKKETLFSPELLKKDAKLIVDKIWKEDVELILKP